jgi:hypothetical protein
VKVKNPKAPALRARLMKEAEEEAEEKAERLAR